MQCSTSLLAQIRDGSVSLISSPRFIVLNNTLNPPKTQPSPIVLRIPFKGGCFLPWFNFISRLFRLNGSRIRRQRPLTGGAEGFLGLLPPTGYSNDACLSLHFLTNASRPPVHWTVFACGIKICRWNELTELAVRFEIRAAYSMVLYIWILSFTLFQHIIINMFSIRVKVLLFWKINFSEFCFLTH